MSDISFPMITVPESRPMHLHADSEKSRFSRRKYQRVLGAVAERSLQLLRQQAGHDRCLRGRDPEQDPKAAALRRLEATRRRCHVGASNYFSILIPYYNIILKRDILPE